MFVFTKNDALPYDISLRKVLSGKKKKKRPAENFGFDKTMLLEISTASMVASQLTHQCMLTTGMW